MRNTRLEFSEKDKAAIFARDRSTCCFSGANLWLLDAPLRPGYQRDWVDHIRPLAQGGKSEVENGACASHSYNAKKRHNTADNLFLFRNGAPTRHYFEIFGPLPGQLADRLKRLAALTANDWYFNRAIGLVLLALDYALCKSMGYDLPKRDEEYWLKAARAKLAQYTKLGGTADFEARGLLKAPSTAQATWISLVGVESDAAFRKSLQNLKQDYLRNGRVWASYFWGSKSDKERLAVLRKARLDKQVSAEVIQCLEGACPDAAC